MSRSKFFVSIITSVFVISITLIIYFSYKHYLSNQEYNSPQIIIFQKPDPTPTISLNILMGTIKKFKSPNPEIEYKYQITLDNKFSGNQDDILINSQGILSKKIFVVPDNQQIENKVITNLNKKIIISGSVDWDFAESKFIKVKNIEIPQN